jgi:hypothetical protein
VHQLTSSEVGFPPGASTSPVPHGLLEASLCCRCVHTSIALPLLPVLLPHPPQVTSNYRPEHAPFRFFAFWPIQFPCRATPGPGARSKPLLPHSHLFQLALLPTSSLVIFKDVLLNTSSLVGFGAVHLQTSRRSLVSLVLAPSHL